MQEVFNDINFVVPYYNLPLSVVNFSDYYLNQSGTSGSWLRTTRGLTFRYSSEPTLAEVIRHLIYNYHESVY